MPDITTLPLLAETFGISIDDLFDLSSEQHLNRIEKRKHGCSPRCRRHKMYDMLSKETHILTSGRERNRSSADCLF